MMKLLRIFMAIFIAFSLVQCATQTTPQGGPKDEEPPILLRSSPKQNETNFKGKIVELTFDEMVKLNNASEEIIITPSPGKIIDFKAKQNKITIEPKDGWKDSTTYSISLREGVQDVTESNSRDTLHLAFSTGTYIDSLSIYGRVKNVLTEDVPQKITVAIYQADTTDIFLHTPAYFTRTDKQGRFRIENLSKGDYFVYAFDDKNKNLKVESTSEQFGFKAKTISLGTSKVDSIFIGLVKSDSRPIKINSIRRTKSTTKVTFNKSIVSYSAKIEAEEKIINSFGDNKSEITFYNPIREIDSIKINLVARDSIEQTLDTIFYLKQSDTKTVTDAFKVSYSQPIITSETATLLVKGSYSSPIKKINLDSISLKFDSLTIIKLEEKDIILDITNKLITIQKKLDKKLFSKENIKPEFILGKAFLTSLENDSSKAEVKSIKIQSPEKTATVEVQLKTEQEKFIIQILNSSGEVQESVRNVKSYIFKNLDPITYKLRVIVDENNNGNWDAGNIYTRTEPENIYYYKSIEGKFEITTRENSDIGPLILAF